MASLKKNIQIIHDGLTKNITIVLGQAQEKAKAAAFEYMQNRANKDLSIVKSDQFETTNAVIAWLTKLEEVVKEMPTLHDDDESPAMGDGPGHSD